MYSTAKIKIQNTLDNTLPSKKVHVNENLLYSHYRQVFNPLLGGVVTKVVYSDYDLVECNTSTLQMETAGTSETLLPIRQITKRLIQGHRNLNTDHRINRATLYL